MTLRFATLADLPALLDIEQRCFPPERFEPFSRRIFRYAILSSGCSLYVKEGDGLEGYVLLHFRKNSPVARLYSIAAVTQGKGLGSELLGFAERQAQARGCTAMSLETRADDTRLQAFYAKHGYQAVALLPDYYPFGKAGVKMLKPLFAGVE